MMEGLLAKQTLNELQYNNNKIPDGVYSSVKRYVQ